MVTLLISFFELFIGLQAARLDGFLVGRHESCLLAECLLGGYKTDLLWVHETALDNWRKWSKEAETCTCRCDQRTIIKTCNDSVVDKISFETR